MSAAVLMTNLPPAILLVYLAASLVTFIVYAIDKSAARKGRWRTKEGTRRYCHEKLRISLGHGPQSAN